MSQHARLPAITQQRYDSKTIIDGVELIQLKWNADDGGNFSEIWRLKHGQVEGTAQPFEAKQISMSVLAPQTVKAYHLHYLQDDMWYVPPTQRLLANLIDIRAGSPTERVHMRLTLGGGKNQLLRIPAGIAHGIANPYQHDMFMIYATSSQFDPVNPDEYRLPWDAFGEDIWQLTKG